LQGCAHSFTWQTGRKKEGERVRKRERETESEKERQKERVFIFKKNDGCLGTF
jgi:hypothetical protein